MAYVEYDNDYERLFTHFISWLWGQWASDANPSQLVKEVLDAVKLKKRSDVMHRDRHNKTSFKHLGFAGHCLRKLWPEYDNWLPFEETLKADWPSKFSLKLDGKFTERMASVTLNEELRLRPVGVDVVDRESWFIARNF
ncbi:hypothetical protein GPECTOR_331g59 [Gonium pectorale]|uniref:Uncharacterized protein n=1 Tax=Gonium pectorale TaxID=33097 RepID=A0A150FVS5_GONPE|nr:hypothetical protein GPECTOR_331g59 [Gonium pectorale]|eukprot:KXZ41668.1 hypothetical protein GPECTOR_331g59 [Gonium pectorale]